MSVQLRVMHAQLNSVLGVNNANLQQVRDLLGSQAMPKGPSSACMLACLLVALSRRSHSTSPLLMYCSSNMDHQRAREGAKPHWEKSCPRQPFFHVSSVHVH